MTPQMRQAIREEPQRQGVSHREAERLALSLRRTRGGNAAPRRETRHPLQRTLQQRQNPALRQSADFLN